MECEGHCRSLTYLVSAQDVAELEITGFKCSNISGSDSYSTTAAECSSDVAMHFESAKSGMYHPDERGHLSDLHYYQDRLLAARSRWYCSRFIDSTRCISFLDSILRPVLEHAGSSCGVRSGFIDKCYIECRGQTGQDT